MAEVYLPQQPVMALPAEPSPSTSEGPWGSNIGPEPNPHFVFPMQSEPSGLDASPSPTNSANVSGTRRSVDRSRPQRLSLNALPAFDFNPSNSSDTATTSPGRSPGKTSPYLNHPPSGHRRNGSEFIGGDGRHGRMGSVMSTSPTKAAEMLPPPAASRAGPPAGRRGHAHRRSGAVSSHDLSNITKPSLEPRGSSLPATPSNPDHASNPSALLNRSTSQPQISTDPADPPRTALEDGKKVEGAQPRARVGFSETIEFIPRPLSTISSDTSSSMSTIRATHSVTGSITSLVSSGTSSPPHSRLGRSSIDMLGDQDDAQSRSRAAESNAIVQSQNVAPTQDDQFRQPSASVSEDNDGCTSDGRSTLHDHVDRPASSDDTPACDVSKEGSDPLESMSTAISEPMPMRRKPMSAGLSRPRSSPEPKVTKKQRKVKSWADSLLSRKPRSTSPVDTNNDRTRSASPVRAFAPAGDLTMENFSFDDDTTCVIRDPSHMPLPQRCQTQQTTLHLQDANPRTDDDTSMMLDLDAALGSDPGESPDGSSTPRRRMHSSGVTGGFSGAGMHYHRRAESAPEMAPIDYHTFGFPRFNSNPRMADVFEEDEEGESEEMEIVDQVQDNSASSGSLKIAEDSKSAGLGVTVVDVGPVRDEALQTRRKGRVASSAPRGERSAIGSQIEREPVVTPTFYETPGQTQASIEIVEAEEEPRAASSTKTSEDSSDTPTLSTNPLFSRSVSAPTMNFSMPASSLAYATPETLSSAVSSPDFNRTSFDMPRLHTATSSITDRTTLNSCRVGDHSLNLRGSVDDVPSLTSSASTMISAQPPRISTSAYTNSSAERSSSLSAAVPQGSPRLRPATAGKRSSLASLSRLVGSSYGERSKLNIEDHTSSDNMEKAEKKKGNRISRLMRFWKSKPS